MRGGAAYVFAIDKGTMIVLNLSVQLTLMVEFQANADQVAWQLATMAWVNVAACDRRKAFRGCTGSQVKQAGVSVALVDPYNASRTRLRGGLIHRRNRLDPAGFRGIGCGAAVSSAIAAGNTARRTAVDRSYAGSPRRYLQASSVRARLLARLL